MRKYIQPKIKAVELHPEQAILQTCKAGGIYMWSTNTVSAYCSTRLAALGPTCRSTPKGGNGVGLTLNYQPSYCDKSQSLPS